MMAESSRHETLLNQFVRKLQNAAGDNLIAVVLYGSAADGEFHAEYSDLNLLCIVRDSSFTALARLAGAIEWWRKQKRHTPLVLTRQELKNSSDVFSVEFIDMKQRHRVLYGEDVLRDLVVPMQWHRAQLAYELREKLFLLRQHLLLAGNRDKGLWEVMLNSLSSFTTLFRHVLIELGEPGRKHSREAVEELASRLDFDASPFVQLMEVRGRQRDRRQFRASEIAATYLSAIEKVTGAVDTMQGSAAAPPLK
jgi:predicted nucleotidyltransferase